MVRTVFAPVLLVRHRSLREDAFFGEEAGYVCSAGLFSLKGHSINQRSEQLIVPERWWWLCSCETQEHAKHLRM